MSAVRRESTWLQGERVHHDGHRDGEQDAKAPSGCAQIRALAQANLRFWASVAPLARRELACWREIASEIDDETLRRLALSKLRDEAFNAEVAATLATLAPRRNRKATVKAIVALEILFDYLDGRTETLFTESSQRPAELLKEGRWLFETFDAVITGHAPSLTGADSEYLHALWRHAHKHYCELPAHALLAPLAGLAASRCAEAQLRLHAATALGDEQLRVWAEGECIGSGLRWREYVGGCASSVLAVHALIASAAREQITLGQARALDATYLAIGAVITTLDSLVDDAEDRRAGEAGYLRLFVDRHEIEPALLALLDEALRRTSALKDGAHHAMTLAGVAAYYTTHPGAGDRANRAIRTAVRRRLSPAIWPTLLVLAGWRGAKRAQKALAAPIARADKHTAGQPTHAAPLGE